MNEALELSLLVDGVGRNGEHCGVLGEHVIRHGVLIVLHGTGEQQTEHEKKVGKQNAHEQNHIAAKILKNHPQLKPCQKRQGFRQGEHPASRILPQIPAEKFQWGQTELFPQCPPGDGGHHQHRHHGGQQKRLPVPDGHIGRQAVAAVVHSGADVFQNRIAQDIAHQCADKAHQNGGGHIVANQLAFRIAAGKERADDVGLLGNGCPDGHGEHEGHDRNDDVQEHDNHGSVAAHVVAGKADGLVQIPGHEAFQRCLLVHFVHHVLGHVLFLLFVRRRGIVEPAVAIEKRILVKIGKVLLGHKGNAEQKRVEHGVVVVLEQGAVVRQGNEAGNGPASITAGQPVANGQMIVFRVHPVDGDLSPALGQTAGHKTGKVHLLPVLKNPHSRAVIQGLLHIEIIVQRNAHLADVLDLGLVQLLFHPEIAVFHMIFFEAFIVGGDHAAIGHQKAGDQGDGHGQQQKNHDVFSRLAAQLPENPLTKRILYHSSSSAPTGASLR